MKVSIKLATTVLASTVMFSGFPASSAAAGNMEDVQGMKKSGHHKPIVENFVDQHATNHTKSLFEYLENTRGKRVLFGHQHSIDEGLTLTGTGKMESDVKNAVGDFPAVFGWDTLSLEGKEKPGVFGDEKKSRKNLITSMQLVHKKGGILALSSHMPNFVTSGSFNDTAGSVVEHILPGGDKNKEFNTFLDNIAKFANGLKDDHGQLIPVLFRPFHEQNGGWFWWGAKTTTTAQYKEIYRYTVEYLRDKKGVHNFLYVYSPNGTFGGSENSYLTTYPGDDYVDVLGMDQYDSQGNPGSQQFLTNLVGDLAMISKMADKKGKVATFSEFGYSPQGMKVSGNGDLHWFTKITNSIKADPDARRIAYMQTWANFGLNGNLFVPYRDAPNSLGSHELLPDFVNFYKDPYTLFLNEVKGVYDYIVKAAKERPFMHIASPTDSAAITTPVTKVRSRVLNMKPSSVTFKVAGSTKEVPMKLDRDGYYSVRWSPDASLNGKSAELIVTSYRGNKVADQQTIKVFVKIPELLMKEYNFTRSIHSVENIGAYPDSIQTSFKHGVLRGEGKLAIDVKGMKRSDTWQELKIQLPDVAQQTDLKNVRRVKFDVLIPAYAGESNPDATVRGLAMLLPDWDTKYGMSTTEKKFSELEIVNIKNKRFARYPVSVDLNDPQKAAAASSLALSIVGSGLQFNGTIYVDNIQLFNTYAEPISDPAVVDDFESYQGDSSALGVKFVHAGGDATAVSLDSSHKSSGNYGLKFDYTLAGSGYAGITKSLGSVDWSSFQTLKFWLAPDGKKQKMVVQLKVDGVSYEAYPSLASTETGWVELPFSQFKVAPWDTANQGKTLNPDNLKKVQDFSVYVNAVDGATLSSTLYLDDIEAVN
ncbi:glycosyl hydrolase [Fictibacillus fluitans]|uniref:CIA30 family protein n=1 Tax=Fictibacillus fluitans TaxID=3058422 RepID=A0ABT8I0V7_9BACL|nr:glycosyl hydrolase [Fictibacillus sp. NE201]MDN4526664.1 CIA30 family protein [Fictibacillus sp. NE201]